MTDRISCSVKEKKAFFYSQNLYISKKSSIFAKQKGVWLWDIYVEKFVKL